MTLENQHINSEALKGKGGITASNLRRIDKGAVMGVVDLEIAAWHMTITCMWMQKGDREWVSLPSERYTNRDGKIVYRDLVKFTDKTAHERFQAAALAAIRML
jgi:hypothetical protein